MPKIFFIILFLLTFGYSAIAQNDDQVNCFFQIVSPEREIPALSFLNKEKTVTMRVSQKSFSKYYEYSGPSRLEFFLNKETPTGNQRVTLGSVSLDGVREGEAVLLVIFKPVAPGEPTRFVKLNKESLTAGENRILVANRSGQPIRFTAGEKQMDLMPNATSVHNLDALQNGSFRARVFTVHEEQAYKGYEGWIRIAPLTSILLFANSVENKPGEIGVQIITYKDFQSPAFRNPPPAAEFKERVDNTQIVEDDPS